MHGSKKANVALQNFTKVTCNLMIISTVITEVNKTK